MSQLNEAESKFFESKGQDVAPVLSENLPEQPEPGLAGSDGDGGNVETGSAGTESPARTERERFVPLQALQEERAEKKQLREELKAYREWQAQLAQRLQQMPAQQQQAPMPDPETRPLDYINHVLGNMQASTAELQQWRQQQEQEAQQRAAVQQYASWATTQEQEFVRQQPEYHDAYRYASEARDKELQSLGYSPGERAAILRMNTAEIVHNAMQQGRNPAELVWEYARARGYAPKGRGDAAAKIAAGLQAAGGKLNQGGAISEGELSAKDLAGITDPKEFEKAWKRVFGRKR